MNLNVPICTENPQSYLILSHILSVGGYVPSLMDLQASSNFATEAIPYAILFDTSENTEPIFDVCATIKQNPATRDIILVALTKPCNSTNFLDFYRLDLTKFSLIHSCPSGFCPFTRTGIHATGTQDTDV